MSAATSAQQIEVNRRNAQLSTGPRTPEGKAASSVNATKFGLFATHIYARPGEAARYEDMRDRLLETLRPHGALEESLALQIVNANLRLHRCDAAESAIPVLQNEASPGEEIHDFNHPAQKAIDRARVAAENTIRRVSKDLKELQAERWRRATLKLTGPSNPKNSVSHSSKKRCPRSQPTANAAAFSSEPECRVSQKRRNDCSNKTKPIRAVPSRSPTLLNP